MADGKDLAGNEPGAAALNDRWIPRTRVIARRERAAREAEQQGKTAAPAARVNEV